MSGRRTWLAAGLAGLLLAGSVALSALRGGGGGDLAVATYEVRRQDFERKVWAEGNLEAAQSTLLGPPADVRGALRIAWLAPAGSRVEPGDVVIRFDPSDLEKQLSDGESNQAAAGHRIKQKAAREEGAIRNLERDAGMALEELEYAHEYQSKDPQIFSRIEIVESEIDGKLATHRKQHADEQREIRRELAEVELDLLEIDRRKAGLEVEQAREKLQQLEVRAPHGGIFLLREGWRGPPQVGSMVWGANPVAEIPRLDVMEARVYVLEADAGGLTDGIPATLVLDAYPERACRATVKHVDTLAQRRNREVPVQYFGVVLQLERTEAAWMKPGQRVQATLSLERLTDVLTVPRQAVFELEGRTVVYLRRGRGFEPAEVSLGPGGLGRVVVLDGLAAGDRVALADPTLRPRQPAGKARDVSAPELGES